MYLVRFLVSIVFYTRRSRLQYKTHHLLPLQIKAVRVPSSSSSDYRIYPPLRCYRHPSSHHHHYHPREVRKNLLAYSTHLVSNHLPTSGLDTTDCCLSYHISYHIISYQYQYNIVVIESSVQTKEVPVTVVS